MQQGHGAEPVHLPDYLAPVGHINDNHILLSRRTQGNVMGREGLLHPVPPPVHLVQNPLLHQEFQNIRQGFLPEEFPLLKRQLISRTFNVVN
ncbi:hypothetical protein D3C75_1071760 [compost metagenome]